MTPTRLLLAALALLCGALGAAFAGARDRPSNSIVDAVHGEVAVISRWSDSFEGNQTEFEREYVLPSRVHAPILDLLTNIGGPHALDLRLRSITEDDKSASLTFRDLDTLQFRIGYSEWFHFDPPASGRTRRQLFDARVDLWQFPEFPAGIAVDSIRLEGVGAPGPRQFEFQRVAGWAEAPVGSEGHVTVYVPYATYDDDRDSTNDFKETTYQLGYHHASRTAQASLVYSVRSGNLPVAGEDYEFNNLRFDGQATRLFRFSDLAVRLKLDYGTRPGEVVRNFHASSQFLGDFALTLTPMERSSVVLGLARKQARVVRLNRLGIAQVDAGGPSTVAALKAGGFYENHEPITMENYGKFSFNKWRKLKAHYRYSLATTNQVPPTDVTAFGSTILLPHDAESHEYRLSFTPGSLVGIQGGRSTTQRKNENRDISWRSDVSDIYAYLITFERLTLGVGYSEWIHLVNQPVLRDLLESVETFTIDLSFDFTNGFQIFTQLRELEYTGPRQAREKIAETGIRFSDHRARSGIDGRVSVTFDHLEDGTQPDRSYKQASFNVAGSARF